MLIQPLLALFALATTAAEEPAPAVAVGKPAPDFAVTRADGTELKLSDFRGKTHLVVIFSRAHW